MSTKSHKFGRQQIGGDDDEYGGNLSRNIPINGNGISTLICTSLLHFLSQCCITVPLFSNLQLVTNLIFKTDHNNSIDAYNQITICSFRWFRLLRSNLDV